MAASASSAAARERATTTATASPTWRTSSTAIGGWSGWTMSSVTGHAHGRLPCTSATSRPLYAATTPGSRSAALVSTPVMRAWASGLRRIARCSMPGSVMFSVQVVRPVISRASSLRGRAEPTSRSSTAVMRSPPSRHRLRDDFFGHALGWQAGVGSARLARFRGRWRRLRRLTRRAQLTRRVAHGPDDVLVSGAPAQVAFEPFADLRVGGVRVGVEQVDRGEDHARGAEAALESVPLVEGALHGVQGVVGAGEPFDGGDLAPVGLDGQDGAALHADEVVVGIGHEHGAGAAVAGVATHHGAHLAELLAQVMDEQGTGFDIVVVTHTVDIDTDPGHRASRLRGFVVRTHEWSLTRAPSPRASPLPAGHVASKVIVARCPQANLLTRPPRKGLRVTASKSTRHFMVDAAVEAGQPLSAAAPARRDDLGGDAHGGLLRGTRAQVESDGGGELRQLPVGEAGFPEPGQPLLMGAPRPHGTHVREVQPQGDLQQRPVELRVVGED